jgi:hypothetical protein
MFWSIVSHFRVRSKGKQEFCPYSPGEQGVPDSKGVLTRNSPGEFCLPPVPLIAAPRGDSCAALPRVLCCAGAVSVPEEEVFTQ